MKRKSCSIILCLVVVVFIAGVSFEVNRKETEKPKIRSEMSLKEANTNSIAINVETSVGSGNYTKSTVPETGYYKVNTDKSYCTVPGLSGEQKNIPMEYRDGKVYIGITDEGTKCYVWLDKQELLVDKIKDQVSSNGCPNYEDAPSITGIEKSKSLLCKGKDDFGDTYYYRGKVTNNWVKLGNFYWRIIRFNGNGSIRLIYSGTGTAAETGDGTQISKTSFNYSDSNQKAAKYMADDMNNNNLKNPKNSYIKQAVDDWYEASLKSEYESKLDGTAGFCNDTDSGTTRIYENGRLIYEYHNFMPADRINTDKQPTLKCGTPKTNLYTTSDGTYGNQKLTYPIGLITADEVVFAGGGISNDVNAVFYLCTGQKYWTMSPGDWTVGSDDTRTRVFYVMESGSLAYGEYMYTSTFDVRPVINLKADTQFKSGGDGTSTNPYEVVI